MSFDTGKNRDNDSVTCVLLLYFQFISFIESSNTLKTKIYDKHLSSKNNKILYN